MYVYVESTVFDNVRFQVVKYDKSTKLALMRGEYGGQFQTSLDSAVLEKNHYRVVQSEEQLPLLSAPQKAPRKKAAAVEEE